MRPSFPPASCASISPMRHKYATRGIVLARASVGEAGARYALLTRDLGLISARAQGVRRPGAKLSAALQTFCESDLTLVHGAEGWRLVGALGVESWFARLPRGTRPAAGRVAGLLVRLAPPDAPERSGALFALLRDFFHALSAMPERAEAAECRAALSALSMLGLGEDAPPPDFSAASLDEVARERGAFVARINRGIEASGL